MYAQEAFGRFMGIQVAWLVWFVRLTACAANANLFVTYLGESEITLAKVFTSKIAKLGSSEATLARTSGTKASGSPSEVRSRASMPRVGAWTKGR